MRSVIITLSKDFVLSQKRMKRGVVTFSLETNIFIQRYELIFYDGSPYRIETSLLICIDLHHARIKASNSETHSQHCK